MNGDSLGNLFGGAGYSVSNDFQFQIAGGLFNGIEPRNSYVNTFAGDGGLNLRFGGKAMTFSKKIVPQGLSWQDSLQAASQQAPMGSDQSTYARS